MSESLAREALKNLAQIRGITTEELLEDMQSAIDAAWNNPEGEKKRKEFFPNGKPTVVEFLAKTYKEIT